ncbi:MAG: hypothetical protein K5755_04845 [Clostridiales bacterium]|nr:hypothetical protein [Clostridiales bacterium]
MLFGIALKMWGKVSVVSMIIGMFGSFVACVPLIILIAFALKKTPERFKFYTILCLLSSAFVVIVSVVAVLLTVSGRGTTEATAKLFANYSWKTLITSVLSTVFFIILTKGYIEQLNSKEGYTKRFVICEFVLLSLYFIASIATGNYLNKTGFEIARSAMELIIAEAINALLILAVKYVENKKETIGYPIPLPTEETEEESVYE